MNPLQLYVLAGPNGAGKSTLSETFVSPGTDIFDGDKEMASLRHQYPMTDSGTLYDAANGIVFQKRKEHAITTGNDFAFETNFRTADVMDSVKQFKKAGYQTRLIFIGLPSLTDSLFRVDVRVKAGGHFVDAENVGKNFSGGLENLVNYYDKFSSVDVFESTMEQSSPFKMNALLTIKNGIVTAQAENLPEWVMRLCNEIDKKHEQEIRSQVQEQPKQKKDRGRNGGFELGM
ncbi:zeta toxin family protein [Pedobacter aquatilis]|uniref:zeta toxin family protein n=1 Tax=Pedobacter aquatilis TaxID=351343 RepID=UPI00292E77A9|nr:zeta toxin family protein [Pedobacter aquatilis]